MGGQTDLEPSQEYLRSLEVEGDGALPDGLEPGKKLPPVVAQGKFLRGQAGKSRVERGCPGEFMKVNFWGFN